MLILFVFLIFLILKLTWLYWSNCMRAQLIKCFLFSSSQGMLIQQMQKYACVKRFTWQSEIFVFCLRRQIDTSVSVECSFHFNKVDFLFAWCYCVYKNNNNNNNPRRYYKRLLFKLRFSSYINWCNSYSDNKNKIKTKKKNEQKREWRNNGNQTVSSNIILIDNFWFLMSKHNNSNISNNISLNECFPQFLFYFFFIHSFILFPRTLALAYFDCWYVSFFSKASIQRKRWNQVEVKLVPCFYNISYELGCVYRTKISNTDLSLSLSFYVYSIELKISYMNSNRFICLYNNKYIQNIYYSLPC